MRTSPHEEPITPYELTLDAADLDCTRYACWTASVGHVHGDPYGALPVCADHKAWLLADTVMRFGTASFTPLEQ